MIRIQPVRRTAGVVFCYTWPRSSPAPMFSGRSLGKDYDEACRLSAIACGMGDCCLLFAAAAVFADARCIRAGWDGCGTGGTESCGPLPFGSQRIMGWRLLLPFPRLPQHSALYSFC